MSDENLPSNVPATRRDFLKATTAVAAGSALAANLQFLSNVHAAGNDVIRVGLIGCGGRGAGAAENCLSSAPNVKLVALADAFPDKVESTREKLKQLRGEQVDVKDRCFHGLDAYEKVLASDINYVILATPPGFRPLHLEAAVAAGKNIFTEKPVAVDGPGIRKVLAAYEEAQRKNLHIAAGTQRRHQTSYLEAMKRVHAGEIGPITAARCYWNQGILWVKERQASWSDLEWQIRNWLYFTWLSGDHICEQHVHNLDVVNWAMGTHPEQAMGMGGRQVRTDPKYGQIFDHFAIDYKYPNDAHLMSMCRQIDGCAQGVYEVLVGTHGTCTTDDGRRQYKIKGSTNWLFTRQEDNQPYVQEHSDLIASIREGRPLNELKNVAESTLTAIMGRMSAYTGKAVTWDKALNSTEELMPAKLDWAMSLPVGPVATPGKTPLV
jgi:myo-inositol 2-dehydrogenase/D-chiro-inositol 1-dehydrogenase